MFVVQNDGSANIDESSNSYQKSATVLMLCIPASRNSENMNRRVQRYLQSHNSVFPVIENPNKATNSKACNDSHFADA